MRVLGVSILEECARKHPETQGQLETWRIDTERANWKTPIDIKADHASASIIGGRCVVFNIKGKKYRIVAKVNYQRGYVRVLFADTHAEYDKVDAARLCGEY